MPDKSAIRDLIDEVAAARSLPHLYDSALVAMRRALGVERGAVLVLDERGVMRFVASSGISEAYRRAVEGHSPWSPDEPDARMVLVPDVREADGLAALREVLDREDIRALAFVPIRFGPKLLGKFMLYYDEPQVFSDNETTIAEIIAGHLAFAVEHRRIAGELEARASSERELRGHAEEEAALRHENERRLRLAMSAGQMGTWSWDLETETIEWSEELEVLHGVARGSFDGRFESFVRDAHPEDRARLEDAIRRGLQDPGGDYETEYRILLPDGSSRWLAARGKVLCDEQGRPVRMVGVCSDASVRKRADETEAFLMQASRMLATTLDPDAAVQSLAAIVVPRFADWCLIQRLDETGRLQPIGLSHPDAAKNALGWRIAGEARSRIGEIVARTGESLLIPRIEPEMLARDVRDADVLRRVEALGLCSAITVPLAVRGRTFGTLSLISAESKRIYGQEDVRFAEEIGSWAALAIDNAALFRRAEEARGSAEAARRRLETLGELSAELASSLDPDAMLEKLAQRIVETMADYAIAYAFDGHRIRRLGLAHRLESKRALLNRLDDSSNPSIHDPAGAGRVIRTGQPILAEQITLDSLRQGSHNSAHLDALLMLAPTSAMVVPMKARGRTIGAIAFATTVDSTLRYGPDDLKLGMELATRAALLVDNARLYAEAKAALRARDDMLAVVSHDLRNPLQSISTAATLLEIAPSTERRARTLESISVAAAQMERLLNDLLDVSKMEAGKFSVTPDVCELMPLIDEAMTLFLPRAERKSVRLEAVVPEDAPPVRIDRARILQVLSNLIGNALKFVSAGGSIEIVVESSEEQVLITVVDDGTGIADKHLAKVFDRFWRENRREEGGAGLGLALAKGIVEAHGGTIGVVSREGHGSRFFFRLQTAYRGDDLQCNSDLASAVEAHDTRVALSGPD